MLPPPFNDVPPSACRTLHLTKGSLVFRQGDKTRGLFFVVEGRVELQRFTQAGACVIIHKASRGETFAEASLFSAHYHCDAVTIEDCQLTELDRDTLLDKFRSKTDFALAIAKRFAQQNQQYRRKLELLAIKDAQKRIHAAVLDGMLSGNIRKFATDIGLTHEVVYRGLANLVEKGKLAKSGRGQYALK